MKGILCCIVLVFSGVLVEADIGDSREKLEEHYGKPREIYKREGGTVVLVFYKDGIRVQSKLAADRAVSITYGRKSAFGEKEVEALLDLNAEGRKWSSPTETIVVDHGKRRPRREWLRDDGVKARLNQMRVFHSRSKGWEENWLFQLWRPEKGEGQEAKGGTNERPAAPETFETKHHGLPVGVSPNRLEQLQKLLVSMGVTFPKGATMTYSQRDRKLVVTNTRENQRRIEAILSELARRPAPR